MADRRLSQEDAQRMIAEECDALKALLQAKNRSYGNSFADPINIFAKDLTPHQQCSVRLDDKIKRIANGTTEMNEDTVQDLIGYLVLLRILERFEKEKIEEALREGAAGWPRSGGVRL
jgi:hypothetical protein